MKQIEDVKEEVKNAEVVIAILNGLLGSQDSFMRGMQEVITFSRLWEEHTQEEEARLIRTEEKMGATEDQALTIQRRRQ